MEIIYGDLLCAKLMEILHQCMIIQNKTFMKINNHIFLTNFFLSPFVLHFFLSRAFIYIFGLSLFAFFLLLFYYLNFFFIYYS